MFSSFFTSATVLLVTERMDVAPHLNVITSQIIGAAIEVHRHLGPGLLESTYTPCMQYELRACGLEFAAQRALPLVYKELLLANSYRVDLIVGGEVLVELKCVDRVLPVHEAQLLTYLRLTGCPLGLLINFNVAKLVDGVKRRANTHPRTSDGLQSP